MSINGVPNPLFNPTQQGNGLLDNSQQKTVVDANICAKLVPSYIHQGERCERSRFISLQKLAARLKKKEKKIDKVEAISKEGLRKKD